MPVHKQSHFGLIKARDDKNTVVYQKIKQFLSSVSQPLSWDCGYSRAVPPALPPRAAEPVFLQGYTPVSMRQASTLGCSALWHKAAPSSPVPTSARRCHVRDHDPHVAMLTEVTIPKTTPSWAKLWFLEPEQSPSERLTSAKTATGIFD